MRALSLVCIFGLLAAFKQAVAQPIRSNDYLETKWRAIGSTHPVNPQQELTPPPQPVSHQWVLEFGMYGLRPNIDTEDIDPWVNQPGDDYTSRGFPNESDKDVNYPNDYVGLGVQALFDEAFVTGGVNAASQTWFSGGSISAIGGREDGLGTTSADYTDDARIVGTAAQGAVLSGHVLGLDGANSDFRITTHGLNAFGHANLAYDIPKHANWRETPKFIDALFGGLLEVYVGSHVAGDGRYLPGTHSEGRVRVMIGEDVQVALDNNQSVEGWQSSVIRQSPFDVWGTHQALFWFVYNLGQSPTANSTRMNLGELRLSSNILNLENLPVSSGALRHRLASWMGGELRSPSIRPNDFPLLSSFVGLVVLDLDNTGSVGSSDRSTRFLSRSSFPEQITRSQSAMAVGTLVVGDGEAGLLATGYNTDVVHLNDVLQLTPLQVPPSLNPELPDSEKIGRLFYSSEATVKSGTLPLGLYVSVLEADSTTIGWRRVKVDGQYNPTVPPIGNKDLEDADHLLGLMNEPVSMSVHPLEVSLAAVAGGSSEVTLMISGFMESLPTIEFRLVKPSVSRDQIIETEPWTTPSAVTDVSNSLGAGPNTVLSVTVPMPVASTEGDWLQIRAVDTSEPHRYAFVSQELIP